MHFGRRLGWKKYFARKKSREEEGRGVLLSGPPQRRDKTMELVWRKGAENHEL